MKTILQQAIPSNPEERIRFLEQSNIHLTDLLQLIGDTDSELRDELVFRIFVEALFANAIPEEQLSDLLEKLTSQSFLFHQIGENEEVSVYQRSFSALWISYLLKFDQQKSLFSNELMDNSFQVISSYLIKERDGRGFVENEGWANAFGHAAELYTAAIFHPQFEHKYVPSMLQGIKQSAWSGYVFVDDEDVKFAEVVRALHHIDFPEDVIVEWIEQLFDQLENYLYQVGYTREYFKAKTNLIHIMQAIYFKCKFANIFPKVTSVASYFIAKNQSV